VVVRIPASSQAGLGLVGFRRIRAYRIRKLPGVPRLRIPGYMARVGDRYSFPDFPGRPLAIPRMHSGPAPPRSIMANGVARRGRGSAVWPLRSRGMRAWTGTSGRYHRGRRNDHGLCAPGPCVHRDDSGADRGYLANVDSGDRARPRRLWRGAALVRATHPDHHSPCPADSQLSRGDGADGTLRIRRGVGRSPRDRLPRLRPSCAGVCRTVAFPRRLGAMRSRV